MRRLLSILLASALVALISSAPAAATSSKRGCDALEYGGQHYVFYKSGIACGKAQKWALKVHRDPDWEPRHWDCESGTNFETGGSCQHANRPQEHFFGWHPGD